MSNVQWILFRLVDILWNSTENSDIDINNFIEGDGVRTLIISVDGILIELIKIMNKNDIPKIDIQLSKWNEVMVFLTFPTNLWDNNRWDDVFDVEIEIRSLEAVLSC